MQDANPRDVDITRAKFRKLVAINPNYFGTTPELTNAGPVVEKKGFDTTYEELSCVSYSPERDRIEATLQVKLPFGYSGGLCTPGSNEHVRFYIDYGSGWEDAGIATVNVHDIPVGEDCERDATHPLSYVCGVTYEPRRSNCARPVLPRVRAILSWELVPPPGVPGWIAPWGAREECNIQITPRRFHISDIVTGLSPELIAKVPPLVLAEPPKPIPDPGPLTPLSLHDVAKLYQDDCVPVHRFAFPALAAAIAPAALEYQTLVSGSLAAKLAGISFDDLFPALDDVSGDVTYEELECLGLGHESNSDRLVATFRVKRPSGYAGRPCEPGSVEHVAFWGDWDDSCEFRYLGTVDTKVHDYAKLPDGGLCYAVVLPVDLGALRQGCKTPVLRRVRAVLSWGTAPSTTDPDAVPVWGNRIDRHVQIPVGDPYDGTARFVIVGGVATDEINPSTGLTKPIAHLAVNGFGLDPRGCPFVGRVTLHGPTDPALAGTTYRVMLTNVTTGIGPVPLTHGYQTVDSTGHTAPSLTTLWTPDAMGWATWRGWMQNTTGVIGWFDTSGDDLWQIELEVQGLGIVDTCRVLIDSTLNGPALPIDPANTADLVLDVAGNCDVSAGEITGRLVARDLHLDNWALSVHGGPSTGFPAPPAAQTTPVPGVSQAQDTPLTGQAFKMDLSMLPPCGYIVRLAVTDRAIVDSASRGRTIYIERGLCLRPTM